MRVGKAGESDPKFLIKNFNRFKGVELELDNPARICKCSGPALKL